MSAISIHHPFVDEIFKAVGVSQHKVKKVVLTMAVNEVVTVDVTYLVDKKDADQSEVHQKYLLDVTEIQEEK